MPPEDWDGAWAFLERTQPHLAFDASVRAEVIGRLLEADDHRDPADVGDCRQELAELAPLLTLERFDRRRCNQDLRGRGRGRRP